MLARVLFTAALASLASAWGAPSYAGYSLVWQDTFAGPAGASPDGNIWNIITDINVNGELQRYTTSNRNLQRSGGETLQIVPWNDGGQWTSGRVESKYSFTPAPGKLTVGEALIRFGSNPIANKRGMWPAFWLLGDSYRHGTGWPACGEIDAMETVNGELVGYGTIHCDMYPGGICSEPSGIGATVSIPDQGWHTWRVVWNRQASNWQGETLTWYMDGRQFHQVSGARVGNSDVWKSLAQLPVYFILNVAVGGTFPGYPDGNTLGGYGSMMEVAYVAHYVSN